MKIKAFAQTLLFGTTLEEKLLNVKLDAAEELEVTVSSRFMVPSFPGRPIRLAQPGKAGFPGLEHLQEPSVRGEVLHFFANHELLAIELMALTLLKFPEAPHTFRLGLARTIQEEQIHLSLYLGRMKDFGVEFGDLPVSDYFWKSLSGSRSPLEFVTQMGLTLEQANLDFAFSFMKAFANVGDMQTSLILERVLRDEIGHVKHGLTWFNRWRADSKHENPRKETEWQAYVRILPAPMTPRRAKGVEFCEAARREAGLSENFIRELKLHTGSKGRPPVIFFYNPYCDAEIARGKPGFSPPLGAKRITDDLEATPLFLATDKDLILVSKLPDSHWIESLQAAGIQTPEFALLKQEGIGTSIRAPKIGGLEPWGWSPEVFEAYRGLRPRLVEMAGANNPWCMPLLAHPDFGATGLGKLFSKSWSVKYLKAWLESPSGGRSCFARETITLGKVHTHEADALTAIRLTLLNHNTVMLKAPYGTSGMGIREVRNEAELSSPPLLGWIRNLLAQQGEIIVEPKLAKVCDLSIQFEVQADRVRILDVRRFFTGSRHEYRGTWIGKNRPGFGADELRFLHAVQADWREFVQNLGMRLRQEGYLGPAGVDGLIWRDSEGALRLKPMVELNPRWTMGRVALELEKHLAPSASAIWAFIPVRELIARGYASAEAFSLEMRKRHPILRVRTGGNDRIKSGVLCTNDPARAQEVITVLATLPNSEVESFVSEVNRRTSSGINERIRPETCGL